MKSGLQKRYIMCDRIEMLVHILSNVRFCMNQNQSGLEAASYQCPDLRS